MRAGVSVGTVSNVLNRPNLVAEDTRTRVQVAIDELGFVRNESARQLRQGRGRTVGIVLESMADPYFVDLGRGAEAALNAEGFDVLWCTSDGSPARERRCLDFLEQQRVCGVVITPVGLDRERICDLRGRGVATVLLDRYAADACSVRVDHVAGGRLALERLLDTGHRRLAIVTGPLRAGPAEDRHTGALGALHPAGLGEVTVIERCEAGLAAGRDAARRLLALDALPTGVFCASDLLAVGLVNELLRGGVKVPAEVCVVGYHDLDIAAASAVPLTTVRHPRHDLGWAAAELALAEASDSEEHTHRQQVLEPELVVRDSA
jgi:LacI family transcriptional regulator